MCRFHSNLIYQQPIIAELEYKLRLDDDSLVTSPIEYDLFRWASPCRTLVNSQKS